MDVNVNYNHLRFFIAAAESDSLQEVAEKTGCEISNVSMNLSRFEKQLGVKLFTRNPLKLTDIGKEIYEQVITPYREIEISSEIARNKNRIENGKIAIGCSLNMVKHFFIKIISEALKEYPTLKINLDCEADYKKTIKKLKNNELQFALLDFNPTNDEEMKNFIVKELFKTEYIFVSNTKKDIKDKKELNDCQFITSDDYKYATLELKECFESERCNIKSVDDMLND